MRVPTTAALLLFALACGGPVQNTSGRLLPIKVGAVWQYKISDTAGTFTKKTTVEAYEDVGGAKAGTMAFRTRTEDLSGYSIGWQEDTGTAVVRHHDQEFDTAGKQLNETWYTPNKLRLDMSDAHLANGAKFSQTYTERATVIATQLTTNTSKTEDWTVEAADELVTVPAGTFHAVKLHRVGTAAGGSDKRFWFTPGVGKVKEVGGTRTEELERYSIPP